MANVCATVKHQSLAELRNDLGGENRGDVFFAMFYILLISLRCGARPHDSIFARDDAKALRRRKRLIDATNELKKLRRELIPSRRVHAIAPESLHLSRRQVFARDVPVDERL